MKKLLSAVVVLIAAVMFALPASADTFVLEGDYLRVGVHSSGGLIDDYFTVGIDYDKTGTSSWTGYDVLKPGSPFQFYAVGVNGSYGIAGYSFGNPFSATTTNTSSGTTLSALTTGSYMGLDFSQVLYFDETSGVIHYTVTLANNTRDTISNVVYATGYDPDQDVYAGGSYDTTNSILSDRVLGYAPVTEWGTAIVGDGAKSISEDWVNDPYTLANSPMDDGNGDYTINMGWNFGDMDAGDEIIIKYDYALGTDSSGSTVPVPPSMMLLISGLFGLVGMRRKMK